MRGQWGRVRGSSAVCEHFIVCTVDVGMSHGVRDDKWYVTLCT